MNSDIFNKIYKLHKRKLKYLLIPNKKLLICFSGIPGSGKTYIAKILEKRYKGVRVNSHDIGKIILELVKLKKINKNTDAKKLQNDYQLWLLRKSLFKNDLIILDRGIDREYDKVFKVARKKGFSIFVIKLRVSENILKNRLKRREEENVINYLRALERWKREFKEFGKKAMTDIIIDNNYDLDLKELFKRLDKLVR